jgi:hypothetical protein
MTNIVLRHTADTRMFSITAKDTCALSGTPVVVYRYVYRVSCRAAASWLDEIALDWSQGSLIDSGLAC